MFGFPSIQKLLVLAAIVFAVWQGFKWVGRLQAARDSEAGVTRRKSWWPGATRGAAKAPEQAKAEDMAPCPVCGTYVAARGARNCGRADCPY